MSRSSAGRPLGFEHVGLAITTTAVATVARATVARATVS